MPQEKPFGRLVSDILRPARVKPVRRGEPDRRSRDRDPGRQVSRWPRGRAFLGAVVAAGLLASASPASSDRPAAGLHGAATGAALSEDRTLLAVCSETVTRVYRRGERVPWRLLAEVRYARSPIEGIAWDGRESGSGRRGAGALPPVGGDLASRGRTPNVSGRQRPKAK